MKKEELIKIKRQQYNDEMMRDFCSTLNTQKKARKFLQKAGICKANGKLTDPYRQKCIVKGCTNYNDEGGFIGQLCGPCHEMLVTGKIKPTNSFLKDYSKKLPEFFNKIQIGSRFVMSGCIWKCTDKGTRTISAINVSKIKDSSWLNGPPYAVPEEVIAENDFEACEILEEKSYG